MKKLRKGLSFAVIVFALLPILGCWSAIIFMDWYSTMTIANYLICGMVFAVGFLIYPGLQKKLRITAWISTFVIPIVFAGGCLMELVKADKISEDIKESQGLSYYYDWEEGFWISDQDQLEKIASTLDKGEFAVVWQDTMYFWRHGGNTCSCGLGEPLKLKSNNRVVTLKHGYFRFYGFLSLENSKHLEFMEILQSNRSEWGNSKLEGKS